MRQPAAQRLKSESQRFVKVERDVRALTLQLKKNSDTISVCHKICIVCHAIIMNGSQVAESMRQQVLCVASSLHSAATLLMTGGDHQFEPFAMQQEGLDGQLRSPGQST